jgi:hypothetical protein
MRRCAGEQGGGNGDFQGLAGHGGLSRMLVPCGCGVVRRRLIFIYW